MTTGSQQDPAIRAGLALTRTWIFFALTLAPAVFGSAVLYTLGRHHVLGYWWVSVPLGFLAAPLAILLSGLRTARRLARDPAAAPAGLQPTGRRM
jgi:hypothetical protein